MALGTRALLIVDRSAIGRDSGPGGGGPWLATKLVGGGGMLDAWRWGTGRVGPPDSAGCCTIRGMGVGCGQRCVARGFA